MLFIKNSETHLPPHRSIVFRAPSKLTWGDYNCDWWFHYWRRTCSPRLPSVRHTWHRCQNPACPWLLWYWKGL